MIDVDVVKWNGNAMFLKRLEVAGLRDACYIFEFLTYRVDCVVSRAFALRGGSPLGRSTKELVV